MSLAATSSLRRLRYDEYGDPLNIFTAKTNNWFSWRQALVEEWEAHQKNGTFQFVHRISFLKEPQSYQVLCL